MVLNVLLDYYFILILTFTLGIGVAFEGLILMGIIYVILRLIKNKRDMRK